MITAIELALADHEQILARPLIDPGRRDADRDMLPAVTIVTDNGGPVRSLRFDHVITAHPEKYERLFLEEIDNVLDLVDHADSYRIEYNTIRPHEAIAWNHPLDVHRGLADPRPHPFPNPKPCQLLDARQVLEITLLYRLRTWGTGKRASRFRLSVVGAGGK